MAQRPSAIPIQAPRPTFDEGDVAAHFVTDGLLPTDELARAQSLASASRSPLGAALDRLGLISQAQWAQAVAGQAGLRVIARDDFPWSPPDPPALSFEFQEEHGIALVAVDAESASLVLCDPLSRFSEKAVRLALRREIRLLVATRRDVQTAIAQLREATQSGIGAADPLDGLASTDRDHLLELANGAPTIRFVDTILANALERRATDIHLEPFDNRVQIRMRVDGILLEDISLPPSLYAGVISRLKILAGLDIGERRLPQDGSIRHRTQGELLDIRVSTIPSVHGESMALRLLDFGDAAGSLEALRMPAHVEQIFRWGRGLRSGLIIVTGPTGSGKTTTLHALLSELNDSTRKIVTVENPVEIRIGGVVQVEANPEIGLTFANALRTFLRQDPDVIMVGEIRDPETAAVAIQAALTGHIVLSTLHTNDAPTAIARLVDMGVAPYLVRATLKLASAQRLVRTLCEDCAQPSSDPAELAILVDHADMLPPREQWRLRAPRGCTACGQSGYRGRRAVFEALRAPELHDVARDPARPWLSMKAHGLTLAANGATSVAELLRVLELGTL